MKPLFSLPRLAWARTATTLRGAPKIPSILPSWHATQSVALVRSHAEHGNEAGILVRSHAERGNEAGILVRSHAPNGNDVGFCVAAVVLILVACGLLFFHRLAERGLWSAHEARAAQNADSIVREGCWGLPRLYDGHVELQKPPLYYWLVGLSAQSRAGMVNEWDVRLPAAASAFLGVLLLFGFLAWRGRPVAGCIAALTLATAVHYTWIARVGRIDMPLTLTTAVALLACYVNQVRPEKTAPWLQRAVSVIGYLAVAAGILLKGPIGAVLPASAIVLHVVVDGQAAAWCSPRRWLRSSLVWGVPLVACLTIPWFWWANEQTDGTFGRVFFLHHNFERGFGGSDDLKVYPWWFYGPQFGIDFLPWSPLLVLAVWSLWRHGTWCNDAEARLGLVWFGAVVVLLSCSSFKRSDYLLPAYPGAALVLGSVGERWYRRATRPGRLTASFAAVLLACVAGWWLYIAHWLPQEDVRRSQRPFAAAIREHVPQPQYVRFFRAECHELAFYLGRPLDTFLEWENLAVWARRPGSHFIVMPADCAAEWSRHIEGGRLVEVVRNTDLIPELPRHQHLVLMRTEGLPAGRSSVQ